VCVCVCVSDTHTHTLCVCVRVCLWGRDGRLSVSFATKEKNSCLCVFLYSLFYPRTNTIAQHTVDEWPSEELYHVTGQPAAGASLLHRARQQASSNALYMPLFGLVRSSSTVAKIRSSAR